MRSGQICECGEHGWAAVTKGYVAFVDAKYVGIFALWSWFAHVDHGNVYVCRSSSKLVNGVHYSLRASLHRTLCPASSELVVDHIDGCGLNNRILNLSPTTNLMNCHKQKKKPAATSTYKGVSLYRGKWRVTLQKDRRQIYVGVFASEEMAARAYDAAARNTFGPHALSNFSANTEVTPR